MISLEPSKKRQLLPSKLFGKFALISVLALALSGCGTLSVNSLWNGSDTPDYALISDNLVNTAAQFSHLDPQKTILQVGRAKSAFEEHIHAELAERGYKLQEIGEGDGTNVVSSRVRRAKDDNGEKRNLYVLAIGRVSVERAFENISDKTVPTSDQTVRGGKQDNLALNDEIFEVPDSPFSKVVFMDEPRGNSQTKEPKQAKQAKESTGLLNLDPAARAGNGLWLQTKPTEIKHNLADTMTSNYDDVFSAFEEVDKSVLVFPNDSLVLGDANKDIIKQYIDKMNPETDVLSVLGCSHGQTDISNGNSLLALGRANRVKEAILFSGVAHDQVLEEGCWAPHALEGLPARGVVLTLKRRNGT